MITLIDNNKLVEIDEEKEIAVDSSGRPYTSASRLLSLISGNFLRKIKPFILERARELGEEIDIAIQLYHEEGVMPNFPIPKKQKLFNQYLQFLKDEGITVLATQWLYVDPQYKTWGYADIVAEKDGKPIIVEIKTRNTKKEKPRLTDIMQTLIYTTKEVFKLEAYTEPWLLELSKDQDTYRLTKIVKEVEDMRLHNAWGLTHTLLNMNTEIVRWDLQGEVYA